MNEIITEERTDEVIPAIAAVAGGVARGAAAVGGAALRGGAALARGAAKVGGAAARGVAGAAKTAVKTGVKQAAVSTVGKAMGDGQPATDDKSPEAMRAKQEQKKAIQQSMADAKAQIAALQKELAAIR